jgi:hypothetical protein
VILRAFVFNNVKRSENLTNVLFDNDIPLLFDNEDIDAEWFGRQLVLSLK